MNLSENVICYITSNAYPFSDKARKLRNNMLDDGRLDKIVNFEKFMIFNSASITTCITFFKKNTYTIKAVNLTEDNLTLSNVVKYIQDPKNEYTVKFNKDDVFALVNSEIASLNLKIDGNHKTLSEVCIIGKGMETSADNIFLFSEFPANFPESFIKKRLSGKNMGKYSIWSDNNYILYFEDIDNFEDLPESIQNYLYENKTKLKERAAIKRSKTMPWWKYTAALHKEYYDRPKLYCSRRAFNNTFCLDESFSYLGFSNMTVVFESEKDYPIKYVMALLNSTVLTYRYKSIGKQTGGGSYEFFPNGIGKLPIPIATPEQQKEIINLVDQILQKKKDNSKADITKLECQIDTLVYQLYGLTNDEIKLLSE